MSDWHDVLVYNAKDSAVTIEAWHQIKKQLEEKGHVETHRFIVSLLEPLMYMSLRGVRVDTSNLRKFSEELEGEYKVLSEELSTVAGRVLNPNSPKQLQTYFYVEKKEKPYLSRTTGRITLDEGALQKLARKGYKEATIVLRMRSIRKMKSSYLDVKHDEDGRMRCSYNPAGTTTGRLSSSKTIFGRGLNLQTVPKRARAFFVADPGCTLIEVDLKQAEAMVVGLLAGDPAMLTVFRDPKGDFHQLTADRVGTTRQIAKALNHASNYGLGANKMSLMLSCKKKEADDLMSKYHMIYPGIRSVFQQTIEDELRRVRTLTNLFGRKRFFMDRFSNDLLRAGYSFVPQSTVADLTNRGLLRLYRSNRFDLLAQVHDSVLLQVQEPTQEDYRFVKECMEEPLEYRGCTLTIPAEVSAGPNWRDMEDVL